MIKSKTVEPGNFKAPKAKCDARIVTPSPISVAGKKSDEALFLSDGFQPIQHDRSDIKKELQHQKTLGAMSGLDEYDSDSEDFEELLEIFDTKVVLSDNGPRDGAQSTFRENTIRRISTRSGTTFIPFPEELERTGSSPIEHEKISNKRKQPDSGF